MQPNGLEHRSKSQWNSVSTLPLEKINHRSCNIVTWYIYTCICSHLSIILMYIIYTHTYVYIYILVYLPNFIYSISCLEENSFKTPDLTPKTAAESIVQNVRPREPPPIHQVIPVSWPVSISKPSVSARSIVSGPGQSPSMEWTQPFAINGNGEQPYISLGDNNDHHGS